jgi:hypothetical protein
MDIKENLFLLYEMASDNTHTDCIECRHILLSLWDRDNHRLNIQTLLVVEPRTMKAMFCVLDFLSKKNSDFSIFAAN